jgi:hypothetical protein
MSLVCSLCIFHRCLPHIVHIFRDASSYTLNTFVLSYVVSVVNVYTLFSLQIWISLIWVLICVDASPMNEHDMISFNIQKDPCIVRYIHCRLELLIVFVSLMRNLYLSICQWKTMPHASALKFKLMLLLYGLAGKASYDDNVRWNWKWADIQCGTLAIKFDGKLRWVQTSFYTGLYCFVLFSTVSCVD